MGHKLSILTLQKSLFVQESPWRVRYIGRDTVDDFNSRRPPLDDLTDLGDLDRGLDGEPDLRPARADEPASTSMDAAKSRRRPLLDLFPTAPVAAPTLKQEGPVPRPQPPRSVLQRPKIRPVRQPPSGGVPTYEIFYSLHEKPFSLTPDPKFLYHGSAIDRVVQELLTSIGRRDPIVVVTAAAGTGKTTFCRAALEQIDSPTFTSFVVDPLVRIEDLLKAILIDFGVVSRADIGGGRLAGATKTELTFALQEFLRSLVQLKGFAVVVIDDAHILSAEMLDQVRAIVDTDQPLMQIVLVGEPPLLTAVERREADLDRPRSVRLRLEPLSEDEVGGYVAHRLSVAGGGQSRVEFDDAAIARVYEASRGLPRLVNMICDRAMALGFEDSASVIGAPMVESAARDLDLAAPGTVSSKALYRVLAIVGLAALVLVGAAAGVFVFRPQIERAAAAWAAPPPPPPAPAIGRVAPLETPPPPEIPLPAVGPR